MNARFVNWIWHIRGSLELPPQQSSEEAFDRLRPLFRQTGTSHDLKNDTLTFRKKDQAAQDKMSVFDDGVLRIEKGASGSVLRYHLTSRILLFCFLAPLLFVGIGRLTLVLGSSQKAAAEASKPSSKDAKAQKKVAAKIAAVPMNPIDKALGAPVPEKDAEKSGGRNRKPSATAAYVFAGIFATLYLVGRILEDKLIKSIFRKNLLGS